MLEIIQSIQESIIKIIKKYKIEAIAFVTPTIKRKSQLMTFLKNRLDINLPQIEIKKVSNLLPVQQKNISKLKDKQTHAQKSFIINSTQNYQAIRIIDDILDSGATINELAKKAKQQEVTQQVFAFTITANV